MDEYAKVRYLEDLAESLGIIIRSGPGDSPDYAGSAGAVVRLRGKEILFLNPLAPPADQLEIICQALRARPELKDMYIPPELRDAINIEDEF